MMNALEARKRIRIALRQRSGREWSVTEDPNWGKNWTLITARPASRDDRDYMKPSDQQELTKLLGLTALVHPQGARISLTRHADFIRRIQGGR